MPKLRLVLGPPGSGKTEYILGEVVASALEDRARVDPREILKQPPLVILVPEQQALSMEHRLFSRLAGEDLAQLRRVAASRVRVLSLSRLGRLFENALGTSRPRPSELTRKMLAWRICGPGSHRDARAEVLAGLLAECEIYGVQAVPSEKSDRAGASLLERAIDLENQAQTSSNSPTFQPLLRLAEKLRWLAKALQEYQAECILRGLAFEPAHAVIRPEVWPLVSQTWQEPWAEAQFWVDGFAGFTPSEERALKVILQCSRAVTATVLINRERFDQPLAADLEDWYAPSRRLASFWIQAAHAVNVPLVPARDFMWLPAQDSGSLGTRNVGPATLPRWQTGHPLSQLAENGLNRQDSLNQPQFEGTFEYQPIQVVACGDERAEIELCCRRIMDWTQQRGYRFREISVITRNLEPYAELLKSRLTDYAIPHFIDQRVLLAHHPLAEYLRCLMRLAFGLARDQDVYALFKSNLLLLDELDLEPRDKREIFDELERFGRWLGLKPRDWLSSREWKARFSGLQLDIITRNGFDLDQLSLWHQSVFQPIIAVAKRLEEQIELDQLSVGQILSTIQGELLPAGLREELIKWDAQVSNVSSEYHFRSASTNDYHQRVLGEVDSFIEEFRSIGGDLLIKIKHQHASESSTLTKQFTRWFEFGLGQLTIGLPPISQDCVLVTDIARGRHLDVRATIVLGLAEDTWPAAAKQTPLLTDWERAVINRGPASEVMQDHAKEMTTFASTALDRRIVAAGSVEDASREPYFALVAFTRPSDQLLCLYPKADQAGRERFPSRYVTDLCASALCQPDTEGTNGILDLAAKPESIYSLNDLVLAASLSEQRQVLAPVLAELADGKAQVYQSLLWAQGYAGAPAQRPMPGNNLLGALDPACWTPLLWRTRSADSLSLPIRISPTRLEAYGMCPFKYYASYWLRLMHQDEVGFGSLQIGQLYHRVLQQAFQALIQQSLPAERPHLSQPTFDWEVFHAAAIALLDREIDTLAELNGRQRLEQVRARGQLLLGHLAQQTAELFAREPGRFPCFTELSLDCLFDQGGGLSLQAGDLRFEVTGFIDRLDVDPQGRAVVVDYKLAGGKFELWRMAAGANLQLGLYLLALRGALTALGGRELPLQPIRAELQRLEPRIDRGTLSFKETAVPSKSGSQKQEAAMQADANQVLLDGLMRETEQAASFVLQRMVSLEISPVPLRSPSRSWTACSGCAFRPLCRFDPAAGDPYRDAERVDQKEWQAGLLATAEGELT